MLDAPLPVTMGKCHTMIRCGFRLCVSWALGQEPFCQDIQKRDGMLTLLPQFVKELTREAQQWTESQVVAGQKQLGQPITFRKSKSSSVLKKVNPALVKVQDNITSEVGISRRSVGRIAKVDLGLSSFKPVPVQMLTDATKLKRLTRGKMLLRRLTREKLKRVTCVFTDEKIFYLNPPISTQNNRVWSTGRKCDIDPKRLLVQRAKFSQHVMVSAGVCYGGKGKLHFVDDKAN